MPSKVKPWNIPSQSDERSCGRETGHNGSRWLESWWCVGGGEGETWQKIRQTAEEKTHRSTNTKLKCTVKDKRLPGNCTGSS